MAIVAEPCCRGKAKSEYRQGCPSKSACGQHVSRNRGRGEGKSRAHVDTGSGKSHLANQPVRETSPPSPCLSMTPASTASSRATLRSSRISARGGVNSGSEVKGWSNLTFTDAKGNNWSNRAARMIRFHRRKGEQKQVEGGRQRYQKHLPATASSKKKSLGPQGRAL